MTAIAILKRDEIIAKVAQGVMLKAIASDLGVTPGAISNALHADPEYRQARQIGAEVRLEEEYIGIKEAASMSDISRAREGFRAATWFAEREFPERWAQRTHVTVENITGRAEQLQRAKERVIEHEPELPTASEPPKALESPT